MLTSQDVADLYEAIDKAMGMGSCHYADHHDEPLCVVAQFLAIRGMSKELIAQMDWVERYGEEIEKSLDISSVVIGKGDFGIVVNPRVNKEVCKFLYDEDLFAVVSSIQSEWDNPDHQTEHHVREEMRKIVDKAFLSSQSN